MPVPRRRHCPSRQAKRRSHHHLPSHNLVTCDNCGEKKLAHRICKACGTYKRQTYKAQVTKAE